MNTGSIVDFYDDPSGRVLKSRLAEDELPPFIKEAEFLGDEVRATLPDDVFALVMVDGGERLRKFACVDKGNTALSVIYFMENHARLPEEVQKTAAANLLTACEWHSLQPPLALAKLAGALGAAMGAMTMKDSVGRGLQRHKQQMGKVSDLVGSNIMPTSSDLPKEKTASVMQPYVDVTGLTAAEQFERRVHELFCLTKEGQGRYPIDSYTDVSKAHHWFMNHGEALHPSDRRDYCIKLAARAEEIGHAINDRIKKYAGEEFASDGEIKVGVCTRMQYWAEDSPERDMLSGLMDKYASVSPAVFCEALRQFDEVTGMDQMWDDGIYDPWYTTFGFTKESAWKWEHGNDRVTDEELQLSAKKDFLAIREAFGLELAEAYRKDPQKIFDSLPLDSKRIIARMANDPQ